MTHERSQQAAERCCAMHSGPTHTALMCAAGSKGATEIHDSSTPRGGVCEGPLVPAVLSACHKVTLA